MSPLLTLKVIPEDGQALVQQHGFIIPGYHMNKRHWITVSLVPDLSASLLDELIDDSYQLIVEALPRRSRPAHGGLDHCADTS
jgi:predicted DNA-binding protein (MmcQ/YjbR family)